LIGREEEIEEGSVVERTGRLLQVPVGVALIGRLLNALGQPIDGKGPIKTEKLLPVERVAPGVVKRHPVIEPLHTGMKIIDALVPLGRGQRELILGDRKIGKTTIAVDTILSQKDTGVICIYAAIGQKASTVARVVHTLQERGAMKYTIIVVAFSNEEPAFRYLVPYAACTMGEEFMESGGHALVVYDDLSKHAVTYREISALLKRPIGREAYPGDIFYVHSRLLERAACLRDDLGGGSLTALPIVETMGGDISAFIPTNVISICDGQIFLDAGLFNEGSRPAMDVGLSVSRVGGMAQTRVMKKVAGRLRIDLSQYHEMAQFVKFGAEVDQATLDQLTRGEREREVLKQDQNNPLPLEKQIVILYAVVNGYLDAVPVVQVKAYEQALFIFMESLYPDVLPGIGKLKDLSEDAEKILVQAISRFTQDFLRQMTGAPALTPVM
jgi:F-type H+-transporting ATPase subunit alpha